MIAARGLVATVSPLQRFAGLRVYLIRSMKIPSKFLLLVGLFWCVVGVAAREEFLPLSETRRVIVNVPDGFNYNSGMNAAGELGIKLSDAKERLTLQVTFEPDLDEHYRAPRARRELMHERFKEFVEGSVEKGMQFEELEPKVGVATYCVFTDAKLVGKTELPPNEFLHVTVGVKAWKGIVATFTLFSQDTTSAEYQAAMKLLKESVHEKLAPLL